MNVKEIEKSFRVLENYNSIKNRLFEAKKKLAIFERNVMGLGCLMSNVNKLQVSIWDAQYGSFKEAKTFEISMSNEAVKEILENDVKRLQKEFDDYVKEYNIEDDEPLAEPSGLI